MSRAGIHCAVVLALWALLTSLPAAAAQSTTPAPAPAVAVAAVTNNVAPAVPAARSPQATKARLLGGGMLIALCILLLAAGLAVISVFRK